MNLFSFIRSMRAELVHIKWPTRGVVMASTFAVIIISVVVAAYLAGLDKLLGKLITLVVG